MSALCWNKHHLFFNSRYRNSAFAALSEDSQNALAANSKLKEELAMQSTGMESLL